MATQTRTQRSAAAKRAAATRKRNAAKGSASSTARTTGNRTAETAARSADAAGTQLGAMATSAQRVLYTTVGAVVTASDRPRPAERDPPRAMNHPHRGLAHKQIPVC